METESDCCMRAGWGKMKDRCRAGNSVRGFVRQCSRTREEDGLSDRRARIEERADARRRKLGTLDDEKRRGERGLSQRRAHCRISREDDRRNALRVERRADISDDRAERVRIVSDDVQAFARGQATPQEVGHEPAEFAAYLRVEPVQILVRIARAFGRGVQSPRTSEREFVFEEVEDKIADLRVRSERPEDRAQNLA
jgi:hypothetical protein